MRSLAKWVRLVAAAVILAVTALAAGCDDPADPVAVARLAASRVNVPLGAPVDLTIQFDVTPALETLDEDHSVSLHVFDDRETFLWLAEHQPPVPTSEWQPGQSIRYTHRLKIPTYPYLGPAIIGIGLQSPETGARLALAGDDLGAFVYRAATLTLEPPHESSYIVYGEGWYPAEFGAGGTSWRWTAERAVLSFRNPFRTVRLLLDVEGYPNLFERPQSLSLVVGGRTIREVNLETRGVVHLDYELTEANLGSGDVVDLELIVDQTVVPAEIAGSADARELGIRVYDAYAEPLPESEP